MMRPSLPAVCANERERGWETTYLGLHRHLRHALRLPSSSSASWALQKTGETVTVLASSAGWICSFVSLEVSPCRRHSASFTDPEPTSGQHGCAVSGPGSDLLHQSITVDPLTARSADRARRERIVFRSPRWTNSQRPSRTAAGRRRRATCGIAVSAPCSSRSRRAGHTSTVRRWNRQTPIYCPEAHRRPERGGDRIESAHHSPDRAAHSRTCSDDQCIGLRDEFGGMCDEFRIHL